MLNAAIQAFCTHGQFVSLYHPQGPYAKYQYEDFVRFPPPELTRALSLGSTYSSNKKVTVQFLNDQISDGLKSAMSGAIIPAAAETIIANPNQKGHASEEDCVVTTTEEVEGIHIVKAIIRTVVGSKRIVHRDTQTYFDILLGDNNRKTIACLHFNRTPKYIGIFDKNKV